MKSLITYWSGTGNTEEMANILKNRLAEFGPVEIYEISSLPMDQINQYDLLAFGCPAMGNEELEDAEFRPIYEEVKQYLSNKNVILFGSYGWGNGEWMEGFAKETTESGANVLNTFIGAGYPDADFISSIESLSI